MASLEYPKLWRTRNGPPRKHTIANAVEALNYREWCYLDSNGEVARLVAASTEWTTGGNVVLGMVERAVTGSTDTNIPVIGFDNNIELLLPTTTDAGASQVLAETNVGARFTGYNGATRGDMSRTATTTNPTLEVVELYPGHTTTEAYGWSWCRFIDAVQQIGG
jgi:hypothetical protein